MASPLPTLFGRHHTKQLDLDQPDGCDHDQNVYHYRLVDGQMIFRAVRLGHGWESRPMSWQTLSCYKQRGDMQMAQITKESGRPEPRADKDEIMAKAKVLIAGGTKVAQAARELGVPGGTLAGWLSKEKRQMEKAKRMLESVDSGKGLQSKATEVVICADCGQEIAGCVFTGKGHGPRCFKCAVKKDYDQDNTTDFNVNYEPEDNDYLPDDEIPIPYVATTNPLDAQIDVMLDALWAEKRAKLKAHLKPLLADSEAWEMVKCIVSRGLA
jgi:hypothetical protein